MDPTLQIQLLGNFHLIYGEDPVTTVDTPRLQSFFAYLLLHRDSPLSRQRLSFLFWPDSTESQARTNLRNLLYHLRDALPDVDRFLRVDAKTLWWQPDSPFSLDVDEFEVALGRAEQAEGEGDRDALREALEEAVKHYDGDLLPSCYDDWIYPERDRLKGKYIGAVEQLVGLLEESRAYDAAVNHAQRLLRHDKLHEAGYRRLMRLHALKGNQARALRAYHTCVDVLEKELGTAPSRATQDLYDQLLDRDLSVEVPSRPVKGESPLVGRDDAWRALQSAWRDAERQPHFVLIKGEAGIGKTRLAEEYLRWARSQGITAAKTQSYPAEGELAYTPVTALLRNEPLREKLSGLEEIWLVELSRLIPELRTELPDLPEPERLSESWRRQRLFEACAQVVLRGERSFVLVVDDLQWCDPETLAWLRFLLGYDLKAHLMILATLRPEAVGPEGSLTNLISDLSRSGQLTEVGLHRLDQNGTHVLANNLSGHDLDHQLAKRLYKETEGNPLFVVETVRAGYAENMESVTHIERLPPKIQAVIETRMASLSPNARELAAVAAVVGRGFTFDLLSGVVEDEEEVVQGLDELWQRRVIREQGSDGYDFSHEKFREVTYQSLSPPRRVHLHRRVAEALAGMYQGRTGEIASHLAHHYHRAGSRDQAVGFYIEAGDQARHVYAHEEAIGYYRHAQELMQGGEESRAINLYQGLGESLMREARYQDAADIYRTMNSMAETMQDGEIQAQAWLGLCKAQDRLGDHHAALESAEQAVEEARAAGLKRVLISAILMRSGVCYRLGDIQKALTWGKEALALSEELDDLRQIARSQNLLGLIHDTLGDYDQAQGFKEEALQRFKELEDRRWVGNVLNSLANTANLRGEYQNSVDLYQGALDTMRDISDRDWEKMCLVNLGAAQVGLEEYGRAEGNLRRALDLTESSSWLGLSLTYHFLAEAYLGQDQVEKALAAARKALEYARETGAQESLGAAWRTLGKVASLKSEKIEIMDQMLAAEDCFTQSEEIFAEVGADAERAHTLRAWARYELDFGDQGLGQKMWSEAKQIFSELDMPAEVRRMEE